MANVDLTKRISTEDVVILVDQLCIKCDRPHTHPCQMSSFQWENSSRCKTMMKMTPQVMVKYIRFERAERAMGCR